jgi:arylsulfatase A
MRFPRSLLILLLAVVGFSSRNSPASDRPNILILYADDLGFGDLGCYHPDSKIPTPNLDQLAASGMRFLDGHSSSGICTPSRYALLTGRHHWRDFHGIVNAFGGSVFAKERLTLPEMLKEKGYNTAAIGKWHLGWDWAAIRKADAKQVGEGRKKTWGPDAFHWDQPIPDGPLAHGFDHYFGDTVINFPPYCWIEDDKVVKAPDVLMDIALWKPIKEGNWECRPGPMASDWDPYENIPTTTAKGVEYIRKQKDSDEPFFLYFAFPSPHAPIIPNDEFDGKSQAGPYGDFVYETDDACGQLIRALEESGQADNTIIIFTADNGPEKYAYARDEKFDHWSAHPLRGLKRDIYEGGHHVPFIVKWPGVTQAGSVSDALVSQIDIMATIAGALEVSLPADAAEDSHDLLPVLKGESEKVRTTHIHNTKEDKWAIRHGEWVLISGNDGYHSGRNKAWEEKRGYPGDNQSAVELYHLVSDIGQKMDVGGEHPDKVKELTALLEKIRAQGFSAPRLENRVK